MLTLPTSPSRAPIGRHAFAVAVIAVAVAARLPFQDQLAGIPYITLFPAVAAAAWYGGIGPGLTAVVAGALGAWYFLLPPFATFARPSAADGAGLFLYLVVACFLVGVIEALRRARDHSAALASQKTELVREKDSLLREKEVLIREVHHRVKNQIQTAVGLLRMQERRVGSEAAAQALAEAANRLMALQRAYERLQVSGAAEIDVGAYVGRVVRDTVSNMAGDRIAVDVAAVSASMPPERALPVALIANELVSNAVKHGYGADREGRIRVDFSSVNGTHLALSVADDGIGLPAGFEFGSGHGLGAQIVLALATTLEGHVAVERDGRTRFIVTFPR